MIYTKLTPDPECRDCGGTGCVRRALDCECLLREAKVSLWRRAVDALVGDPRSKGRSMVAGRRQFLKTLATGAAAGVAATVLPKVASPIYIGAIGRYEDVRFLKNPIQSQKHDLVFADDVSVEQPLAKPATDIDWDPLAWYSIYGQQVLESSNIVIAETA